MVSKYNRQCKKIEHYSVNACLAPVVSMHGLAVTTVEGIGSTKTKLHVVQERLAKFHGSQCGFCTPGIVMSMYTLLRNKQRPTSEDLDVYFQGNLCRCTGYRPIIESFQTFVDGDPSRSNQGNLSNGCCKSMNECGEMVNGCGEKVNGKCCMLNGEISEDFASFDALESYHPDTEPIFPPELQLSAKLDEELLFICGKYMHWYRPTQIEDLIKLKQKHPNAKIVVGNTELGIEMKFKNCQYPIMIQATHVKELTSIEKTQSGIKFGASVTLSELESICVEQARLHPSWKVQVFTEVLNILHYFGGKQIRNVAAIGGNIMTGSPISDLNPIWLAAGCHLEVQGSTGSRQIKMDDKFFTGYRRNVIKPEEVLVSIHVPYLEENDHFVAFKQARRRDDDISIVNAAFLLRLHNQQVEDIRMCFGGMAPTAIFATNTMENMRGKIWSMEMIEEALSTLSKELQLDPAVPGGMVRFRQSLALSFLFKFYLKVSYAVNSDLCPVAKESQSATKPLTKGKTKSTQIYSSDKEREKAFKAVGRPQLHASGKLHVTGEAAYCDDIPKFENELYLGLVLSQKAHAKIVKIDATKALDFEGVCGFICHEDLPKNRNTFGFTPFSIDEEVFASTTVIFLKYILHFKFHIILLFDL